jgi:osmoprotectant transport system permease protein
MELLSKAPQVADILNKLAGKISDIDMATLNYAVDGKKMDAEAVAKDYLKNKGLIK